MKAANEIFAGLRTRARIGILIEAAAIFAAAFAVYAFSSYALDRGLELELGVRICLLLLFIAVLVRIGVLHLQKPLGFELSDDEIALAVEREDPDLRQSLVSAVQFERALAGGAHLLESTTLMRHSIDMVQERLLTIPFGRALNRRRQQRSIGLLGVGLMSLLIWGVSAPSEMRLWAMRNLGFSSQPWPRDTQLHFLDVTPGEVLRIAEREDLTLRVAARGIIPDTVNLRCEFSSGEVVQRAMDQISADSFSLTLETLIEGATMRAYGGDGETEDLQIMLIPRPRITDLKMTIVYPEYLGREAETIEDSGGDLRMPRGSRLDLEARSSKLLSQASISIGQDQRLPATLVDGGRGLRASFSPQNDGILRIDVLDQDKLGPIQPAQIYLRLVDDQAPTLDYKTQGIGSLITRQAMIHGLLKARDDYGLASLAASFRISDVNSEDAGKETQASEFAPAQIVGLEPFQPGSDAFTGETLFDLKPLSPDETPDTESNQLRPGHMLSLRFAATDYFSSEREGYSETLHFRVVSAEKLLEELRRRQEEQRRDLERVFDKEVNALADLREIIPPSDSDVRGRQSRLRVAALARGQTALGRRVQGISDSYARILEEMINNRLFEPGDIRPIAASIVSPLRILSAKYFPNSAALTGSFAETGDTSTRDQSVAAYEEIIQILERVLESMAKSESLAALVEALKLIIRTEAQASDHVKELRNAEGESIFGTSNPGKSDRGRKKK